jgi:hypothetical protein
LSVLKSAKLAISKSSKKESTDSPVAACSKNEETPTSDSSRDEKAEEEPVPSTSKDNSLPSSEESRKAKLLAVAPKLPFDIDLYHWEDDRITAPTMVA